MLKPISKFGFVPSGAFQFGGSQARRTRDSPEIGFVPSDQMGWPQRQIGFVPSKKLLGFGRPCLEAIRDSPEIGFVFAAVANRRSAVRLRVCPHAMLNSMAATNPFYDPLRFERPAPECAMVILGANGDLTKRKLMPALYRLAYDRRLPARFAMIGTVMLSCG
jgi:Glucose-6-phosphate dehydrogenase, NAD binding domain